MFVTVQSHLSEMEHLWLDIHDATKVIQLAEILQQPWVPTGLAIELLPKTVQVTDC